MAAQKYRMEMHRINAANRVADRSDSAAVLGDAVQEVQKDEAPADHLAPEDPVDLK